MRRQPTGQPARILATVTICLALAFGGCRPAGKTYRSFSDFPGFEEYYAGRCLEEEPSPAGDDRALLLRHRPRLILPDGGRFPIDFYRDYLPYTVLRSYPEKSVVTEMVTPEVLKANRDNKGVYLDFQAERYRAAGLDRRVGKEEEGTPLAGREPVVYGRIIREQVSFQVEGGINRAFPLTFLKYNVVFSVSGLPAGLPKGYDLLLRMAGISPEEWHDLDNFVVVHVVLDEEKRPMAVILSQHNSHRTYLVDAQIPLPPDGRIFFDVALRSNEVYPTSDSPDPVRHRAIRGNRYLKYLLSGKDPPFLSADDVTQGRKAGGKEISYDLVFLSPCDPFYTARILLGEPRHLFGRTIGRDGPPGADYYAIPALLPLGNLLKFGYLRDGDPEDIRVVEEAVDEGKRTIDVERITVHGGKRLFRDWTGGTPRAGSDPHGR